MVHYAVVLNGKVIGTRSSKGHAQQVYTHAVVLTDGDGQSNPSVISYHGSLRLANTYGNSSEVTYIARHRQSGRVRILNVNTSAKRLAIGDDASKTNAAWLADAPAEQVVS